MQGTVLLIWLLVLLPAAAKGNHGNGLPFNRYSWLTTHNSFAQSSSQLISPTNQQDNVTSQLHNGVRGLMLDMYDFQNDIWLCHSFGGVCYNFTAFQAAINVLKEIQVFLEANPSEVITIFIEDYVTSPQGLTKVFDAARLAKYWFPLSQMPKNGEDWPLLSDMISNNQRLIVFTSKKSKEATEGIAYEWNYVVENQYGDEGMKAGSCVNRSESFPMNEKSKSLVLMNYFPTNPNITEACRDNSKPLASMLDTCYKASGNRWANFIAVDFYMANATFGSCVQRQTRNFPDKGAITHQPPSASSATRLFSRIFLLELTSISLFMLMIHASLCSVGF